MNGIEREASNNQQDSGSVEEPTTKPSSHRYLLLKKDAIQKKVDIFETFSVKTLHPPSPHTHTHTSPPVLVSENFSSTFDTFSKGKQATAELGENTDANLTCNSSF